jgi:hypothetical protein
MSCHRQRGAGFSCVKCREPNYVSAVCIKMDGIRLAKGLFDLASPILILPLPVSAKVDLCLLSYWLTILGECDSNYSTMIWALVSPMVIEPLDLNNNNKKKANPTALMTIIVSILKYQHCSDHMMYSDMERSTSNSSPASWRVPITVLIDPVPFPLSFSQFHLPEYVADVRHAMVFHSCFSPV